MTLRKLIFIFLGCMVAHSCRAMQDRDIKKNRHREQRRISNPINAHRGQTALIKAAKRGNLEEVGELLRRGANVNIHDEKGNDALYYACHNTQKKAPDAAKVVTLLLAYGADPNKVAGEENGGTPLHAACKIGNAKIVRELLDKGANPNIQSKRGVYPLHYAPSNLEIIPLLLNKGANLANITPSGNTILHLVCKHSKRDALPLFLENQKPEDIIKVLKTPNNAGFTPLTLAHHDKELSEYLENFIKKYTKKRAVIKESSYIYDENTKESSQELKINEKREEDYECPLCLEPCVDPLKKRLQCGHSFHPQCIQDSLKRDPKCPLCRTVINEN